MKTSIFLRGAFGALLPATLLLAACGKKDAPAPTPTPDQASVRFVHDIASASAVSVKTYVGTQETATLNYGQSSGYVRVPTGAQDLKINASQTNTALSTINRTLVKDVSYSVFAYRSGTVAAPVAPLVTEDVLTAPGANKAKLRLVNLGIGTAAAVGLSRVAGTTFAAITPADVAYGAASAFAETDAGSVQLFLTSNGLPTTPLIMSNPRTLTAGKIYTVVIRGTDTPLTPDQSLVVDFIENN